MNQNVTKKSLGLWVLTALVAGNMIGSGIFMLPASLARFGTISIVSWLLTGIGTIFLAIVFARLSRVMPRTGGPYVFCHEAYGDFIGFQVAYNYWIAMWVGNAAIAVTFVGYMSVFFPIIHQSNSLSFFLTLGVVWLITLINILGVKQAGTVTLISTILKLIPLIMVAIAGFFFIEPNNLMAFNVSGVSNISALTAAATLTMWSFVGFESATVPADNVIDPHKNIPRATLLGTSIAGIVYIACTLCIMGMIPMDQLSHSVSPFADAASVILGKWGLYFIAAAGAIACFGTLNGWILMQGQVPMAAARDGLFPKSFSKVSKNGTPVFGLVLSSLLITGLLTLQYGANLVEVFTQIILLATLASLVPYIFTSVAELLLYLQQPERFHASRFRLTAMLAIVAFLYAFWAISGAGDKTIAWGMLLFLSGIPLYIWLEAKKNKA